jgi:hypothetical protein
VLPPVTVAYLDVIWDQTTDGHTDNALKVWERFGAFHPRIALQDSFSLVNTLIMEARIPQASHVWDQAVLFAGLADLQGPSASVLWDGGFESGITGGGFSWSFPQTFRSGVQVLTDTREKHSGNQSLRLVFDGSSNVTFNGVCHLVPVQPSTSYRFSAWVKTKALTSDQGIRFQLRSVSTQDYSFASTSDVHGTQPWTLVELPWSSGKDVQRMQVCVARAPSDQDDNRIRGMAWVDDVALVPAPTEHPKP